MLYYLVDALPALLGSMATLWAVCSPRHWFVRSSFLAALLLLFLLIPAYELLVSGCVQIAVIWGGITWWRKRRNAAATAEPWRVSLRNLLLFTVLAAVAMAVLASFPDSPWIYWLRWTWPGFVAGCVTLFGVWLVIGRTRWTIRLGSAIVFAWLAALAISLGSGLSWVTRGWTQFNADTLDLLFLERTRAWMSGQFAHHLPVIAIGMGLLCAWLALSVKTRWFDPFGDAKSDHDKQSTSFMAYVSGVWIMFTLAIASLPVALLVKLALLRDQPKYAGRKPASFEFLYEAANMIDDTSLQILGSSNSLSNDDLQKEVTKHDEALERMRKALEMPTRGPRTVEEDTDASSRLMMLLYARDQLATNLESTEMQTLVLLDFFNLYNFLYLDARILDASAYSILEARLAQRVWNCRLLPNDKQRRQIVNTISGLESHREDWMEIRHRQCIEDINWSWQLHLHAILDDWYGYDRFWDRRLEYHTNRTKIRLMLVDLALLSFQEANGRLPDSLEELVPDILKELPTDPYADGPLRYFRTDDGYTLYSVGPNGVDDNAAGDDMTLEALMQPTTP